MPTNYYKLKHVISMLYASDFRIIYNDRTEDINVHADGSFHALAKYFDYFVEWVKPEGKRLHIKLSD